MKKQHWRRRSLFSDNAVTKRKVTVLHSGVRHDRSLRQTLDENVVNVNHRQLLSEGVITHDQLSLLQRLLDRDVVDSLCSAQVVKTYQKLGTPLDRFAMRLFLEVGSRLSSRQVFENNQHRLAYINQHIGYRYNLAAPKSLAICLCGAITEWVKSQTDQDVISRVVEMEQLDNQLQAQKEYWTKLASQQAQVSSIYIVQQLDLIKSQQLSVKEQLESLNVSHKEVANSHLFLLEEWQPYLDELKALAEFLMITPNFFVAWEAWCKNVTEFAPELSDIWEACDHVYRDLNAVAKLWQWFRDMHSVSQADLYYFDVQSGQCGYAFNHLSHR